MVKAVKIEETLETIKEETSGEKITIGDIAEILKGKGFGALLIAPSLITILPTGAIPGVPAICGLFIVVVAVQMIMSRKHLWLPKKLKDCSFSRDKYNNVLEKSKPYLKRVDKLFYPRLKIFMNGPVQRLAGLCCVALSAMMGFFGFIPLIPIIFASATLWFGVGFSTRDGLLVLLGFIQTLVIFIALPSFL